MKTPRKPSPARSVGTERPIRQKRRTLSVGSDRSNVASRLTALIEPNINMESFLVSPLVRRSILSDNTNIDEPKRTSWWKKLGENSRDFIELLEENKIAEPNNIIEELDIEVLSQEKRNYTMDLPESSDSESISSIVIPQRKLFTQTDNIPQKNFAEIIGKRDTLAKLHSKPLTDDNKTINVRTRELFQNKQRSKPIFPAALLDISPNKTAADKTEFITVEPKAQVRNIFGNRATKRKNIFTNFIVAESEDEIPEIEPKAFGFQMKLEARRRGSSSSRGVRDYSPASSITTDIEMDDWKMLPSSTMVENQLEIMMVDGNSSKRARLSKLTEIESEAGSNTTKQSYKSSSSKGHDISRKTKTFTKEKSLELEPSITTRSKSKVSQNDDVVEEMFGHHQEVENKYSKDSDKSRKSKTFTKEKVPEFETSITTKNKLNGSQIDDDLEEVFRLDKEVRNKSSKDTEKPRKSKTFTKEKAPELETSMTARNKSKVSQNDDVVEEIFGLDQEVQNKYSKDSDKSRKSKTFTKEKAPEFETSITTRNKSNVSKIDDDFEEVFRIDQEVRNKSTDDTDKSRKSKTFTKEKLLDLEISITTRNKMKISQHGEEMSNSSMFFDVQNKSKSKTADMSQSSSKTRSQGNKNSPNSSQIVENVLNNKLQVTNKSKSKSIATSPQDNNKNMAAEEIPLPAADHENDDELNLTLKYDDENNEDQKTEEVPENIQDTSETSKTITSKEAKTNNSKVNNKVSEVQNESAVESQNQKKASEIKENLIESEAVQNQEAIENGSKNENQSLLPNQSVHENDEIDDINETQVAEGENAEEENESLGEEQNDSELGHSVTQEENESQEEQENESGVENNESLEEQENESEIEQNKTQELNESQEDQQNESEIEQNESEEVETENEEDDGEQSLSQEIVENTDQEEVEQDTEEQNKNEIENQEESEADADSDNENDKDDVANDNDEQVASGQENEENETTNKSHETTGRNIKQNESPELILFNDNNHLDSSVIQGKTEITKSMQIQPSLATVLESTSFSDSTKNSSLERSGWDSHRTTRKTLRQTFGKDFTPRKSLRTLVMEKIAKRQTQNNEIASGSANVPQGDEASVTAKFTEANETLVTAKFSESNAASVTTKFRQANETASVTAKFPQANSTELPEMSNRYDDCENDVGNHDSNVEVSPRTRQTSLDLYFKEITKKNADIRLKIEQEVRDSLNAPPKYIFKEPTRPAPARRKAAPKPRQFASTIFMGEYSLPAEVIEDMKYKPPKRFQPRDAPWITKRLYQYLETKLEPKYNYKARVRAEKLVEHIYNFTRDVRRRRDVASPDAVAVLKRDMARLDIVKTHFEFYEFFYKFMPRDVRIKVNPDVVNKISVPRNGVFSDIL